MSSKTPYIGGDPLPRPDISDRGERGTPIKPKVAKAHHQTKRATAPRRDPPAQTAKSAPASSAKAPSYRAPDNYYAYGRPGTNDMGPSSPPKTISLGKLPASAPASQSKPKSTPKGSVALGPLTEDSDPGLPEETGIVPIPPAKQAASKHSYKVRWS